MAHATSDAPKSSEWVAVRVCAIVLCALQLGQAARFVSSGSVAPALLVTICVIAGIVMGMISLMRPSYEVNGHMNGASLHPPASLASSTRAPASPALTSFAHEHVTRVLARFDYKVSLAVCFFFLSVAISGIADARTLLSLSAVIGLLGFAVALTLGVRDLKRRRRLPA